MANDAPLEAFGQIEGAVAGERLLRRLPGHAGLPRAAVESSPFVARAVVAALIDEGWAVRTGF